MYDRIPSPGKENRVSITQDNGQVITGVLAYADDATQEGSAYTKGNVLPDSVLSLIGLPTDPSEPADMFNVLATAGDLYVWRRTTSRGTDYPVSVNPNAYQEGSDAKPAGYTLGKVQSGGFAFAKAYVSSNLIYSSSISVSDDGTINLDSPTVAEQNDFGNNTTGATNAEEKLRGSFFYYESDALGPFSSGTVYFIPEDANFSNRSAVNTTYVDKYQTVTGYPAIPAGTTIEYLGKLGDKSRMQIVSYVGTGTYGVSNPCSITADFPIKVAFICYELLQIDRWVTMMQGNKLTNAFNAGKGFGEYYSNAIPYGKKSVDGKSFQWYNSGANNQFNETGVLYNVIVFG